AGVVPDDVADINPRIRVSFRRRTTAFTCRAGCKERDVSKHRNAGPVKCNALLAGGSVAATLQFFCEVAQAALRPLAKVLSDGFLWTKIPRQEFVGRGW